MQSGNKPCQPDRCNTKSGKRKPRTKRSNRQKNMGNRDQQETIRKKTNAHIRKQTRGNITNNERTTETNEKRQEKIHSRNNERKPGR